MSTPIISKDLSKCAPKSPRERIGGFVIAGRAIDKCRASLDGTLGNYQFNGLLDNVLFTFKGITAEQFKTAVAAAKTYEEVGDWLQANGTSRTPAEIKAWSDQVEASSLMNDPLRRSFFIESCSRLMMNPEMMTTFDWLEVDDARTSWPTTPANSGSVSTTAQKTTPANEGQNTNATVPNSMAAPVFGPSLHRVRQQSGSQRRGKKNRSRENTFSKSRDNRENRGIRQAKTTHSSRTQSSGNR